MREERRWRAGFWILVDFVYGFRGVGSQIYLIHGDIHGRGGEQEPGGAGADADGDDEEGDDEDAPAHPDREPVPVEDGVLEAVEALRVPRVLPGRAAHAVVAAAVSVLRDVALVQQHVGRGRGGHRCLSAPAAAVE